jgi:hypothetical protein
LSVDPHDEHKGHAEVASGEASQPVESFVRENAPVERAQGMNRVAFVVKLNGGQHIQFFRR